MRIDLCIVKDVISFRNKIFKDIKISEKFGISEEHLLINIKKIDNRIFLYIIKDLMSACIIGRHKCKRLYEKWHDVCYYSKI